MTASPRSDVIVAGAGFSGAMVAIHLLRLARGASGPIRISLFDPRPRPGPGRAYSTSSPGHLLNVRAGGMSAFPEDPEHFVRWARRWDGSVEDAAFLPRSLYGDYLSDLLERERDRSRDSIEIVRDEVIDVIPREQGLHVRLRKGDIARTASFVLATGHPPPSLPIGLDRSATAPGSYERDPWSESALTGLHSEATLLLWGSGLTAVDVLLEARRRGLRGTIHVLSRRGLLPQAHRSEPAPPWPSALAYDTHAVRPMVRGLRVAIRKAEASGGDWRQVFDSLRPTTSTLWRSLCTPEKRRFLRHARSFWEVHRHRVAPEIADRIRREIDRGDAVLHAGRILRIDPRSDGVHVTIRPRGKDLETRVVVDRVIQCTGPNTGIEMCDSELTQALLRRGLCRADAVGIGLQCDPEGAIVDAEGRASERLFTLGPLRKGDLWESTAVPEIREQAIVVARRVFEKIRSEAAPRS